MVVLISVGHVPCATAKCTNIAANATAVGRNILISLMTLSFHYVPA